ncbi:MAG: hypothetical protein KDD31_02690, partial [Muricauda sp.]|nr:hypothetical protein [Allomuricauda sp.]
ERLDVNKIQYFKLDKDTTLVVETYKIVDYDTRTMPYEGHYPHANTQVEKHAKEVHFRAGDLVVPTHQPGIRYLLETLEPQAVDSFFNWNFFDTVLQQKEGFSPYVFEDVALEMIQKDSVLRKEFEAKKERDLNFSNNWYAQLDWIFQRSKFLEDAYLTYPIHRIAKNSEASGILVR